jgi:DNA-binding MarR family transcriptional regulator
VSTQPPDPPGRPEPDPFNEHEFRAWRGFRRTRTTVENELTRRLEQSHGLSVQTYGILITLVATPGRRLRMTDLSEQLLASQSGMTRAIARLRDAGFVDREQDPNDRRSFIVSLTNKGLEQLRDAQVTHHTCVRELLFAKLDDNEIELLATLYDRAMPGILDAPTWPAPAADDGR